MDNKVFGLTFLAVLSSALLFFGVANAGSYAVDQFLFQTEEFGDNTYIGTTDVSNMEVASAATLFSGNFESWKQNATLYVSYQDATAEYPLDNAEILLDATVAQAQSGTQNSFVFELPETTTRSFLESHFSVAAFSDADVQNITDKLEQALAAGQNETRIDISDDSLSVEKEIISEAMFSHNLENKGADQVVEALNGLQIAPDSQFSLLDFIEELNPTEVTDAELTEIASVIYSAVLKTNLAVDERSIGAVKPDSIPLGQEAAINRKLGIDLVFSNRNNNSFILNISNNGDLLTASFSAYPFVNTYAIQTDSKTEVEPRLIKQFSSFVTSGKSVKEEGSKGVRIEVTRSILADGEELEVETVSTDFYPPVHRVEVYPLAKAPVETPTGETITDETDPDNPDATQEETDLIIEDPANPGFDLDGDPIIYDENGEIVNNKAEDNKEETEEPVYDKSGNLINP